MQTPVDIYTYMQLHSAELGKRILSSYSALHGVDETPSPLLSQMPRAPYPAQTLAIMGVSKRWRLARNANVVAECGSGKTLIALGSMLVHSAGRPFSGLVMAPPHLVEKWARETFLTLPQVPDAVGTEILITKNAASGPGRYIYQAPIGYVTQPKQDKRNQHFVSAEVQRGSLGISAVFLPCEVLREYFYRLPLTSDKVDHPTLYEVMRIPASASPSELRVAFKLRDLELRTAGVRHSERVALERAFNTVGQPELRACYDALLADPEAPAIFPYGGFGSLLVAGEPSRDGRTFFARRIVAFSPDLRRRRFHVPLRRCDFYDDRALCRDMRRKLEFWLDPAALHTLWDRTWNQWKHLLGTKIEVEGT